MSKSKYDYIECGCCGEFHPYNWNGDCRDNTHRFTLEQVETKADFDRIYWLEEQMEDEKEVNINDPQ